MAHVIQMAAYVYVYIIQAEPCHTGGTLASHVKTSSLHILTTWQSKWTWMTFDPNDIQTLNHLNADKCLIPTSWITYCLTWGINIVHLGPRIIRVWLRVTNIWTQRITITSCNWRVSHYGILSMIYWYWMSCRDVLYKDMEKMQAPCKIPVGLLGLENQSGWA